MPGLAISDDQGRRVVTTSNLAARLAPVLPPLNKAVFRGNGHGDFIQMGENKMHVYAVPLRRNEKTLWALGVFHDASYIDAQNTKIWRDAFKHVLIQMLLISGITLLIVRWSMERPIKKMAQWLHDLRAGSTLPNPDLPGEEVFKPLAREVTNLADSLKVARASAEEEARLRETADSLWTAERLRVYQQSALEDSRLFVVSNREPYEHVYRGGAVETRVPASGLVTAMEPILRACHGTWVAHGAGDADHHTVDAYDRLGVPPEEPQYTLRRVWLSEEEEERHYYCLVKEELSPLWHIAHTPAVVRADDFGAHRAVH